MTHRLTRLAAAALAAFSFAAQAAEFRSSDVHNSDDYPTVAAVKHMSELLKKGSGGKHSIKVFNKGALGTEKETIDQTKIGALDLTRVNISPMNAICPKTQVPTMPFLFRSFDTCARLLDGPVGEEIPQGLFEAYGFVGLASRFGRPLIYGARREVLADAKGHEDRVGAVGPVGGADQCHGCQRHAHAIGEVYTGLKTGLIDAAENNIPSYDGFKHYER